MSTYKKKKISISTHTSKWIVDLTVKCKTIKLLEDNTEKTSVVVGEQSTLTYNTKSTLHKKKKLINWTSSEVKTFSL